MNKKILLSLSVIAAVAAVAVGGTIAYFSDTETSTGNTFTAGTIDIAVDNMNPWSHSYALEDMKPGYTDYINFEVENTANDANPVNVYKSIKVTNEETGAQSEPECTEEVGTWDNTTKTCTGMTAQNNNLSAAIVYDLYVEVYNATGTKVWWQAIYVGADGHTLDNVYGTAGTYGPNGSTTLYLGMIPAGGTMKVKQSYHLDSSVTNWAQGDKMTFDINLTAQQLTGTATLENKTDAPNYTLVFGDGINATLTYIVKNPTFNFTLAGRAPLANTAYTLLAMKDPWPQTGSVVLGTVTTDGAGNFTMSGDINTGDMKDQKISLVKSADWNGTQMTTWNQTSYLTETGLIWYAAN